MNPKAYGRIAGAVLLLVGVAGFFQRDLLGMDLGLGGRRGRDDGRGQGGAGGRLT